MSNEHRDSNREQAAVMRIIDANRNRAAEGLRAVEEYCRFVLNDAHLTESCRSLRHDLVEGLMAIWSTTSIAARDTPGDVGIVLPFQESEIQPSVSLFSLHQIAVANSERVKQALRAIEEYAKVLSPHAADKIAELRYQWYTLEKAFLITAVSQDRLAGAKLYVLIDGGPSECAFVERAESLIQAGIHIVQLRDKDSDDRTLLSRARLLRQVIDNSQLTTCHSPRRCLFIMNDRPDLAVLAGADGVHIGQEELTVHDARAIVGTELLVGVSTHTFEQAQQAVLDGANYIGCGPTFPSGTKQFDHFPGLELLRQVAARISLPAFAIGGITLENIPQVRAAGFSRVAVHGTLSSSTNLEDDVRRLVSDLEQANP